MSSQCHSQQVGLVCIPLSLSSLPAVPIAALPLARLRGECEIVRSDPLRYFRFLLLLLYGNAFQAPISNKFTSLYMLITSKKQKTKKRVMT